MLYRATALKGFEVQTKDGFTSTIHDLFFDDESWTLRYFVVETGNWLSGRKVLIGPEALTGADQASGVFLVNLTEQQIKDSPAFDSEQTVSRYHEERLRQYYGWAPYWTSPTTVYPWVGIYTFPPYPSGSLGTQKTLKIGAGERISDSGDGSQGIHLRSLKEVTGYGLRATDGDIGELDDMLIDPGNWRITHLVADTRKWWPGGQVVIDRGMVDTISWEDRKIVVDMTLDEVKNAPPYSRNIDLTDAIKSALSMYYHGIWGLRKTYGTQHEAGPSQSSRYP